MLHVQHFSFEFIFQNTHKSKLIKDLPRVLMPHAIPTCPTLTTVIYCLGPLPLLLQLVAISFSLRVDIVPWGKKVLQMAVRVAEEDKVRSLRFLGCRIGKEGGGGSLGCL